MIDLGKIVVLCLVFTMLVPRVYSMDKRGDENWKSFFTAFNLNNFLSEENIKFKNRCIASVDEILKEVPDGLIEELLEHANNAEDDLNCLQKFFSALWEFAREMSGQKHKEELCQ